LPETKLTRAFLPCGWYTRTGI